MRATTGPKDRFIDDMVPVMVDRMSADAVRRSQISLSCAFRFRIFFSGTVNFMETVSMWTPSHSPDCLGSS